MATNEEASVLLGRRIRQLRRGRGWTQAVLAERSGLSPRFLGQLESGAANVSVGRLSEVATTLGVSLVTLLAGVGPVHDLVDRVAAHVRDLEPPARALWEDRLRVPVGARKIALVGLRGAGKSTVGAQAAARLGCGFVVIDDEVRSRSGLALSDLFEMHGASGYHRLCRDVLRDVLADPAMAVIEIGGSVVADPESWSMLHDHTCVIWLRAGAEAHLERVAAQGDTRPMEGFADAASRLREILTAREPLYQRAHRVVDTENEGLVGAVEAVVAAAQSVTPVDDVSA